MEIKIKTPPSVGTQETYRKRVLYLENLAITANRRIPAHDLFLMFPENITNNTFKQYKAALRWFIRNYHPKSLHLLELGLSGLSKPQKQARRLFKRVPKSVSEILLRKLLNRKGKFSRHLYLMLRSILLLGMRPVEIKQCYWKTPEREVLVIVNAKYNGSMAFHPTSAVKVMRRGNGQERELELQSNKKEIRKLVDELKECEKKEPWHRKDRSLRYELKAALKQCCKENSVSKSYSNLRIYDFRHQFAADAKVALGTQGGFTAALMGHASARTAVQYYGKKSSGRGGLNVTPSENSVAAVSTKTHSVSKFLNKAPARPARPSKSPKPSN